MPLSKFFNFLEDENKIYINWEKSESFKSKKNQEAYSIMMPPPNVTGSLHMGHALTFTIQDILIRYHRMQGKEVLWQAGTDHAGIATQMVVERKLSEEGLDRRTLGREKFIEKVWEWKEESGGSINNQLRRLGASADWSRERFTMDEGLSEAVKKVFVDLYNDGIIYRDKRLVNWDPKLLTAISDLEVEQKEQEGSLWHIKYPIDEDNYIIIATTRPETMLGDSAVAVHPDDSRYKDLIGKHCNLPLVEKTIPIIADEYADPKKGSGAVKITPAHDFNDFEVGKRHQLEFINIFDQFAKINENAPSKYHGLDRFEARQLILEELQGLGLLIKEEKQDMVVPYGDRSGVVIEPWLTDQWFCNAKKLSIDPIKSVKDGKTNFVPKNWENTFFNWMENIQPWCISRQLWWGHQIPAWYGPDKKCFVALSIDDANLKAKKHYGKETELIQDEDVLDTWFSSALWTFSTLDWPNKTYELERFYPGNVLVTGFDIIFFWVARMMMFGMEFLNKEPFRDIYVHALVRDEKGQKMSKSKGNVIDPLDLINKYSADALRFTLLSMASPGTDVKLSEDRVKGYRNFLNKLWNANNFLITNECDFGKIDKAPKTTLNINKWIYSELLQTKDKIEKNLKDYRFDEAAKNAYQFAWHSYCDWYIELSKTILFSDNEKAKKEVKEVSAYIFKQILIILHPFIPFVTEKIWLKNKFDRSNKNFLMHANWPTGKFKKDQSMNDVEKIINIISELRSFKNELNVSPGSFIDISINKITKKNKSLMNNNEIILKKLGRINNFFDKDQQKPSATLVISGDIFKIYFDENIDLNLIKENLIKRKNKYEEEMGKLSQRLSNKGFKDRAPKNIVEQEKTNYINLKDDIKKISLTIKNL